MSDGRHWPIGIIAATSFIVCICAITIYIALLQPVQEDADMMVDYHKLSASANDIIVANIIFNQKYTLSYTGSPVSQEGSTLSYKITDKEGNAVNDAKFKVILSRPILEAFDITLDAPKVEDGNYIFENVKVTKKGRWNILARISVGNNFRHMNLKSDTEDKGVYEYGLHKPMRNAGANN